MAVNRCQRSLRSKLTAHSGANKGEKLVKNEPKRYCTVCNGEISRFNRNGKYLVWSNYVQRLTCSTDCAGQRRKGLTSRLIPVLAIDHFNFGRISLIKGMKNA